MSAHRVRLDRALAAFLLPDPLPGNTTAGSGILTEAISEDCIFNLKPTSSSTEIRTAPDPLKAGLIMTLVVSSKGSGSLVVRFATPFALVSSNNYQYLTFATAGFCAQLFSVPCATGSYVGSQSTVTNATGYRWFLTDTDGPTSS